MAVGKEEKSAMDASGVEDDPPAVCVPDFDDDVARQSVDYDADHANANADADLCVCVCVCFRYIFREACCPNRIKVRQLKNK